MHIAIVRTEFIASRGGAERYAVNLAHSWLSMGHRITVVCAKHDEHDSHGMEVVRVSRPGLLGPYKHSWFASRAGRAARDSGADAVLCLARSWPGDVLRLGDGLHKPWMAMRYPDLASRKRALFNPRHSQLLKLERDLFLPGRFVEYVANSELVKRQVVHMYGVEPSRVSVIPNGVDVQRFNLRARAGAERLRAMHGIEPDAVLVLFSGMDFRRKGLLEAVRGFVKLAEQWPARKLHFACVGRGDPQEAKRELGKRVEHSTFLEPTDAIEEWYGAAQLFALPTMHDPSANAITEALACGTPVLTSQENGARQHVVEGVNGFTLRNRTDAREFAARAIAVLGQPRSPSVIAEASPLISLGVNAARMLEVLQRAAGSRDHRTGTKRGFKFTAQQQDQWHRTSGRSARLRLLRGWLWESGASVPLHELARRLDA